MDTLDGYVIYDPSDDARPWTGNIDIAFYAKLKRVTPFPTWKEAERCCSPSYKVLSLDEARLIEALRSL